MITKKELLKTKEYWLTNIQLDLFRLVDEYLEENKITRTQFAEILGVTKGYVSQILNGDFNHTISKWIELALSIGKVPKVEYKSLEKVIEIEMLNISEWNEQEQEKFIRNIIPKNTDKNNDNATTDYKSVHEVLLSDVNLKINVENYVRA